MSNLIAICPGGGLGDHIVALPIIDFLYEIFPGAQFDFCMASSRENIKAILGPTRLKRVNEIYSELNKEKYKAIFDINEFIHMAITEDFLKDNIAFYKHLDLNNARLELIFPWYKLFPHSMHVISEFALKRELSRVTLPQWSLGMDSYKYPELELSGAPPMVMQKPYITINDGWNASDTVVRSTKAWAARDWIDFIALARAAGLTVVQLGNDTVGNAYDVDVQLRGKLSLRESFHILYGSSCHVDIEGGLVHAAAALDTPAVVLFGPTGVDFFGYRQNYNLTYSACQNCFWLSNSWGHVCAKTGKDAGITTPLCMRHRPDSVLRNVQKMIKRMKQQKAA